MKLSDAEIAQHTAALLSDGWLAGEPLEFQKALLPLARWQRFEPGAPLVHAGDRGGGMFGVATGWADILPWGAPTDTPICELKQGPWWFGTNPLVADENRIASVSARTDVVAALFPRASLNELLVANPTWWRCIANLSNQIILETFAVIADLMIRDSRRRAISTLLRAGGCRLSGIAVAIAPIGQNDLAAMANLSRQTTGATLREFRDLGWLEIGYRHTKILNPEALRAFANS